MVTMRVTRDSGYADYLRAYAVLVDGKKVGELSNGDSKIFSVAPGAHKISLKIDWCGSQELAFVAIEGQPLSFHASSNVSGWRILIGLWYVLIARDTYLLIQRKAK